MYSEDDQLAELKKLNQLNEDIDQLSAMAWDCDTLCREVKALLDLAWWFTEDAVREEAAGCSAGCKPGTFCACCYHYAALKAKAARIRGLV